MKLLLAALLAVFAINLFAQTNYQPGYIVKSNGDTVKGYIDYREWAQTPKTINFRLNKSSGEIQPCSPQEIKGFGISGVEEYISYNGSISADKNVFPDLPGRLDTSKIQAVIFLKSIIRGNHLALYSQNDETKTRFFIAESKELPVELKYYQYYDNAHNTVERAFYRGQMIFYINKYKPVSSGLVESAQNLSFGEGQLGKLVNKINEVNYVAANTKNKRSGVRFFVGAGVIFDKIRLRDPAFQVKTNSGSFYYDIKSYSNYTSPEINLGFDLFVNPNVQRFIFRTDVSLSTLNGGVNYPITLTNYGKLKFNQYKLAVIPQLLYNIYNKEKIKFYINGGVSANFAKYSNVSSTSADIINVDLKLIDEFNSFWISIPLQTGIVINKKVEISATYVPYSKFTTFTDFTVSNQSYALGLRYFF
ncbi:MAG TPA: hypothetical protein VIM89_12540 [Mucilaginibacter sp.]